MVHPSGLEPRPMVNEVKHNGAADEDQQQQQNQQHQRQQQNSGQPQSHQKQPIPQQVDVRMKRHPELQPYVPSDRDKIIVGNKGQTIPGGSGGGGSSVSSRSAKSKPVATSANDAKPSLTKPKKCVSMTRLDQLAKPKKVFTKETIINKQPAPKAGPTTQASRPIRQQPPPPPPPQQQQQQRVLQQPQHQPTSQQPTPRQLTPQQSTTKQSTPRPVPKQSPKQPTPQQPTPQQPLVTQQKSTPQQPLTPQDQPTTPQLQTPQQQSAPLQQSTPLQQQPQHQLLPEKQPTKRLSLLEETYQSAASELSRDTTNGINFRGLADELEAELIAEGIVPKPISPRKSSIENNGESPTLSVVTIRESPKPSSIEDDERRLKAEEELKEQAKKEDQERQFRTSLVDEILSKHKMKINQSS